MPKPRKRQGSPFYWYDFTVNGHRFRGSTETNDYKLAKDIIDKKRADALKQTHFPRRARMTLDEACGRYWIEYAQHLATRDNVKDHLSKMLAHFGKQAALEQITQNHAAGWVAQMRIGRAAGTVNRVLSTARKLWSMANTVWGVEVTPIAWHKLMLLEPEARTRWLTESEAENLITHAAEHLQPVIRFALMTGLRLGNITGLTWDQVQWQKGVIELRIKSRRPGRKTFTIPIIAPLSELLQAQSPAASGHVFTYRGQPIKQFRRSFATACKRAGIEDFHFHDLRHTAATWMRKRGVPLDVVQEVLGHEDIATTKKYAHVDLDDKREALSRLTMTQSRHNENKKAKA